MQIEAVKQILDEIKDDVKGLDPRPSKEYKLWCNNSFEEQCYTDGYMKAKHDVIDIFLKAEKEIEEHYGK